MPGAVYRSVLGAGVFAAAFFSSVSLFAQTNATAALTQINQAVSAGLPILKVAFEGTATFYAGSTVETGTASFTADPTGLSTMRLAMGKYGTRTEQVVAGPLSSCTWSGADDVSHEDNGLNCWRSAAWFFPPVSLQLTSLLAGVGVSDYGTGKMGEGTYRHLQSQLVLSVFKAARAQQFMRESTMDLWLDRTTMLPAVLTYSIRPDSGAAAVVPVEVRYSKYQKVSGVQVPFHVERYINGSLQLSIDLSGAQIN